MYYVVVLAALVACAQSHDVVAVGKTTGEIVFNRTQHRSPALWKRNDNVTVSADKDHVISKIVVVDNREDKDGDVRIVDGGIGRQNVTLELKSPSVLRGYDFYIEVYAVEGHEQIIQHPRDLNNTQETTDHSISNDTKVEEDGQKPLQPEDGSQQTANENNSKSEKQETKTKKESALKTNLNQSVMQSDVVEPVKSFDEKIKEHQDLWNLKKGAHNPEGIKDTKAIDPSSPYSVKEPVPHKEFPSELKV